MPYINKDRRRRIYFKPTRVVRVNKIQTAGELNYAVTELINEFFMNSEQGYQAINDVIGALEGAKAEFQRRIVAPYEDEKIKENGDVY